MERIYHHHIATQQQIKDFLNKVNYSLLSERAKGYTDYTIKRIANDCHLSTALNDGTLQGYIISSVGVTDDYTISDFYISSSPVSKESYKYDYEKMQALGEKLIKERELNKTRLEKFSRFLWVLFCIILFAMFIPITLKACDHEYEYEQAKHAQWKYERENGLPYTSFSGE